jgi:hypothetical protein
LESLVGRTFERRGMSRRVASITGYINWDRPKKNGSLFIGHTSLRPFLKWLSGAREVKT